MTQELCMDTGWLIGVCTNLCYKLVTYAKQLGLVEFNNLLLGVWCFTDVYATNWLHKFDHSDLSRVIVDGILLLHFLPFMILLNLCRGIFNPVFCDMTL